MKGKLNIITASFLISILFISLIVSAAGSGDGGTTPSNDDNEDTTNTDTGSSSSGSNSNTNTQTDKERVKINNSIKEIRKVSAIKDYNCEDFKEIEKRIKCRLVNRELADKYNKDNNIIPEACRLAENKGRCVALYRVTQTCFKLEGRAKDACFKRAIGLRKAHFNETENYTERNQHAREYVVTLLYDLQEKVENQLAEGKITEDDATNLIEMITEIKELILNNAKRDEIKPKMTELKNAWRNIIKNE